MILNSQSDIDLIRRRLPYIEEARSFTANRMSAMRAVVNQSNLPKGALVVANGSYARGEASKESDLDFLILCEDVNSADKANGILPTLKKSLFDVSGKASGEDHTFGTVKKIASLRSNIGGNDDTNENTTRRVLYLLEGEWLSDNETLQNLRADLIGAYVRPSIKSHQIALFLLNDIIRYYRTICVDFEFKTVGNSSGKLKSWGPRNIKLIFSRKLLYFSGVVTVAATAQSRYKEKVETLNLLLSLPVVDRLIACCGEKALPCLRLYEQFLLRMSLEATRRELDGATDENRDDNDCFCELKDLGHHFSWELMLLLKATFEASHPIHRALVL